MRYVYCVETDEIYVSAIEAAKWTLSDKAEVVKVCEGIIEETNGFHFRYV